MGAKDRLAQWLGNERLNSNMRSELMELKKIQLGLKMPLVKILILVRQGCVDC